MNTYLVRIAFSDSDIIRLPDKIIIQYNMTIKMPSRAPRHRQEFSQSSRIVPMNDRRP
jgi:hypothetical protein